MRTLLIFCMLLGYCVCGCAQFQPNTRWPYLYENFTDGTIYFVRNQKSTARLNIHLWGNVLHYVNEDGKIYESNSQNIVRVKIGEDVYLYGEHQLMKLLAEKSGNVLLQLTYGDFDAMNAGTGAYGASLNSSAATDLTSLDLGGMDKPSLAKMLMEKNDGRDIPLRTSYYFIINDKLVAANKKGIAAMVGENEEEEWKTFLKKNKIKWKREDSLIRILDFFAQK